MSSTAVTTEVQNPAPPPPSLPADKHYHPSYRSILVAYISGLVLITGLTLTLLALNNATTTAAASASSSFHKGMAAAKEKTKNYVLRTPPLVTALSSLADDGLQINDPNTLSRQLLVVLKASPGITWISYSNSAGTFVGVYRTAQDKYRINQSWVTGSNAGTLIEYQVRDDGIWDIYRKQPTQYDPRLRPFYKKVLETKTYTTSWVGPYLFYDQGTTGVTCAHPVLDLDGKIQGVMTIDFDLSTLSEFAKNIEISAHSELIIITSDGVVLADPGARFNQQQFTGATGTMPHVRDVNDPLAAALFDAIPADIRALPQSSAASRSSVVTPPDFHHEFVFQYAGHSYYASASPFDVDEGLTWIVAAAAPQSDFLAGAYHDAWTNAALSTIAVLAAMGLGILLARRVSGPILSLVAFMRRVGAGELEARASLGGAREFRELSAAINTMILHLRDRLRMRHSLAIAQQIQRNLLPESDPKLIGLDLAGHSSYCDETGGDYYDFIILDESRSQLLVAIGDMMGHGVAAALPMAGARAILRNRSHRDSLLGKILGELNRSLADDLRGMGFMTMLIAHIDRAGNTLRWASAGHDAIIGYDPAQDRFFELEGAGLPLGIEKETPYDDYSHANISPGQLFLLGTDGVWEAINPSRQLFGKDRLKAVLRANEAATASEIRAAIIQAVESFRAGVPQKDDMTFVVIKIEHMHREDVKP